MIKLTNVNKYFNKRKGNEIHVIDNTSIELGDKGLVTFLGNSGCGKTTLLNAIGGLDQVDSGEIFIDGQRLTKIGDGKKDEIRNANIGYIFQNYNLIEDRTVYFNVEIVLRMMGIRDPGEIEKRVMFILDKVGIARYKNRPVKALSGGERQRVGIARALVKSPKIIIADEPTGNLDSKNTIDIMNIIKAISKEKLVILVTHERNIAEFYADRIVEIIDGKIVSDKENDTQNELDYRMENKIYLKDMPVQESISESNGLVDIKYYSDNPDKPLNMKVVVKNNNIYIELPEGYRQGSQTTELVDGSYEKIGREIYEDFTFDYDDVKGTGKNGNIKYTSVFSWWEIIINGYKKIFSYSAIKKILLLGFVFAALFTMYSVSIIACSRDIKDEDFMVNHKNYLSIETGQLSPEILEKYQNMDGVDYALPGNGMMSVKLPIDDYYQSAGQSAEVDGAIASKDMLDKKDIVFGKLPVKENQVVIDQMLVDKLLEEGLIKNIGVYSAEKFIGRTIEGGDAGELQIVGVSNSGSPAVYVDQKNFLKLMVGSQYDNSSKNTVKLEVNDYHRELAKKNISLKVGEWPKDGEVILPYDNYGIYTVGSTSNIEVNGKKLKVSGFYEDRITGRDTAYVSTKTFEQAIISASKNLVISPADKDKTFAKLQSEAKVHDIYKEARDEHVANLKNQMFSTLLVAMIILIISLIEIYLILRTSFLSRIKEVGVLRAIGLKKKDVYKMFLGEIIAMTTLTSVPAFIVMGYYLYKVQGLPFVGEFIKMDAGVAVISVVLIVIANLIFGLLPVFTTMRKTPAAILARNDVN